MLILNLILILKMCLWAAHISTILTDNKWTYLDKHTHKKCNCMGFYSLGLSLCKRFIYKWLYMVEMKATRTKLSTQVVEPLFLYGFILLEVENCSKSWYNRLLSVHIHYSRTINLMSATWIIWMCMARTNERNWEGSTFKNLFVSLHCVFQFERNHDWIMLQTAKLNLLFSFSRSLARAHLVSLLLAWSHSFPLLCNIVWLTHMCVSAIEVVNSRMCVP